MKRISAPEFSRYYRLAKTNSLLDEEDGCTIFYDLSILQNRVERLQNSFPKDTLHAIAIKSNPLLVILKYLNRLNTGLEAASVGEVHLAMAAGLPAKRIVFDSPVKSDADIKHIDKHFSGVFINADSLYEVERYAELGMKLPHGLRVNPQLKVMTVEYLNVSGAESKFGEPIIHEEAIFEAYSSYPHLQGLHVHQGSQFHKLEEAVLGVRKVLDLALAINQKLDRKQVNTIDIGGGFPVNYMEGQPFDIQKYAHSLRCSCPELFDGTFMLITEFGRFIHASGGWVVSEVEHVKSFKTADTLMLHTGADMFLRECYRPGEWYHQLFLLDSDGELKKDNARKANLAGPLCFAGDYIAKGRELPAATAGDKLVIADAGANSYALWSRHCSRQFPKVICYSSEKEGADMYVAKERESYEQIIRFWS